MLWERSTPCRLKSSRMALPCYTTARYTDKSRPSAQSGRRNHSSGDDSPALPTAFPNARGLIWTRKFLHDRHEINARVSDANQVKIHVPPPCMPGKRSVFQPDMLPNRIHRITFWSPMAMENPNILPDPDVHSYSLTGARLRIGCDTAEHRRVFQYPANGTCRYGEPSAGNILSLWHMTHMSHPFAARSAQHAKISTGRG